MTGRIKIAKAKTIEHLIDALSNATSEAILTIGNKIRPDVVYLLNKNNLPKEDLNEMINDAILILITSIKNGKYTAQGYHPAAYAMGVVRKLISNKLRTKKAKPIELDDAVLISDFDTEGYIENKERQKLVANLIDRLGKTCQQLIRLKYFENLKDREIIELKLTNFSTTNSIKSKRSQCMNSLLEITKKSTLERLI